MAKKSAAAAVNTQPDDAVQRMLDDEARAKEKSALEHDVSNDITLDKPAEQTEAEKSVDGFAALDKPGVDISMSGQEEKSDLPTADTPEAVAAAAAAIAQRGIDRGPGVAAYYQKIADINPANVEKALVSVPKAYRLTLDNGLVILIPAGVQKLERFIVNHPWSKANGAEEYDPRVEELALAVKGLPVAVKGGYVKNSSAVIAALKQQFNELVTPEVERQVMANFPPEK